MRTNASERSEEFIGEKGKPTKNREPIWVVYLLNIGFRVTHIFAKYNITLKTSASWHTIGKAYAVLLGATARFPGLP